MGRMQTHPTRYPTDLTVEEWDYIQISEPAPATGYSPILHRSGPLDNEWDYIQSLVPAPKSGKGKRGRPIELERRRLVNAIFYVVRSGCAWRLLPSDFGPWPTGYGDYHCG